MTSDRFTVGENFTPAGRCLRDGVLTQMAHQRSELAVHRGPRLDTNEAFKRQSYRLVPYSLRVCECPGSEDSAARIAPE